MNFELTDEQIMFRDMARKFAEQEIAPYVKEWERQHKFDQGLIKKIASQGLLVPHIPQEYGGLGLDYVTSAIIWEELSKASYCITQAATGSGVLLGTILWRAASEEQRQKWLIPLCKGDMILAGAAVEPNAGSDATAIETTATLKGDRWVINGTKNFITLGSIADVTLVLAQTDKSKGIKGIGIFAVDNNTPGFSAFDIEGKISWLGGSLANLRLTDVEVPPENQVGEIGRGLQNMMQGIDTARLHNAIGGVGIAQSCLDSCIKYTTKRVQFGKPIASFQLVQGIIAEMAARTQACRLLAYHAADLKSKGVRHVKEMSYAKWLSTELAIWASSQAIQLHGAYGLIDDYPVGHHYRDAVGLTLLGGTREMHQLTIGRELLGIDAISR